jgi:hypothetical protein
VIPSSAVRRGVGQYAVYFLAEATASGHEERFPPTKLSAGYAFRKETIAGLRHNGRDAPIEDLPPQSQNCGLPRKVSIARLVIARLSAVLDFAYLGQTDSSQARKW